LEKYFKKEVLFENFLKVDNKESELNKEN